MIILLPDGTVQRHARRRFGRLSALHTLLVPLTGLFATLFIGLLGF